MAEGVTGVAYNLYEGAFHQFNGNLETFTLRARRLRRLQGELVDGRLAKVLPGPRALRQQIEQVADKDELVTKKIVWSISW